MTIQVSNDSGPGASLQQGATTPLAGARGRIVRVTDEDYTVGEDDSLIILTSDIAGTKTLTFAGGKDGQTVRVIMPIVPGAGDFATAGLAVSPGTLDAANDNFIATFLKDEDIWSLEVDGVA